MHTLLRPITFVAVLGLALAGCAPAVPAVDSIASPTTESTPQVTQREAQVQTVDIQVMDTNPPQVNAVVRGNLSESCATLAPTKVTYGSNAFEIKVFAVSPTDRGCAQVMAPFETTVPLDIRDLPAGMYTVHANGVSAVFTLRAEDSTPTVAPTAAATAVPTSSACIDELLSIVGTARRMMGTGIPNRNQGLDPSPQRVSQDELQFAGFVAPIWPALIIALDIDIPGT